MKPIPDEYNEAQRDNTKQIQRKHLTRDQVTSASTRTGKPRLRSVQAFARWIGIDSQIIHPKLLHGNEKKTKN